MHLFVYQTPRHRQSVYSSRRLAEHVYHGEFDLERLRKGLGNEYKIWGYGTHKLHKGLAQLELSSDFKGHIIELEDAKKAVWLRLNYDVVGHHGTEYKGLYRDIDYDYIDQMAVKYHEARVNFTKVVPLVAKMSMLNRSMDDFNKTDTLTHPLINQPFTKEFNCFRSVLIAQWKDLEEIRDKHNAEALSIKEEVKEYLESKKA
jgi:hypothetical protein